ncbi:hypothetical protein NE237_012358 [Protea cynaroides]|uniref:Uncharacterized protein n=1 Tax=Protea cynaroides TaxID=273540 RepID=A0A9Q0GXX6_9MAGN|nr:hypothetical protein NE237_012358 [Protea cynaroides]
MRIRGSSAISSSHAAIYINSLASSSSNSHSSSPSSIDCQTRREGLDILAEAVHFIAGSALPMGVPVTRRRIIIRRKNISEIEKQAEEMNQEKEIRVITKPKKRKRVMALPSKYQDSVLQPWKRQNRRRRSMGMEDDGIV